MPPAKKGGAEVPEFSKPVIFDEDGEITLIVGEGLIGNYEVDDEGPFTGDKRKASSAADIAANLPIVMKVSAKCLQLASSVFKAMLKDTNFEEGRVLKDTGRLELNLPDDDPEPLLVLMTIIHLQPQKVDKVMSTQELVDIAILVDKYELLGITKGHADQWIKALKKPGLPARSSLKDTCLGWLTFCWVFRHEAKFKAVTEMLVLHDDGTYLDGAEDYPIPKRIINLLVSRRLNNIRLHIRRVGEAAQKHHKARKCRRTDGRDKLCDTLALARWTELLSARNILPFPEEPYKGVRVAEVCLIGLFAKYHPKLDDSSLCEVDMKLKDSLKCFGQFSITMLDATLSPDPGCKGSEYRELWLRYDKEFNLSPLSLDEEELKENTENKGVKANGH